MTYRTSFKQRAQVLRAAGWTHREIARELEVSLGSVSSWCSGIKITSAQKKLIELRRNKHSYSLKEREALAERLRHYRRSYSREQWILRILQFQEQKGRMPLKQEFNAWHSFARLFGSWNNAIRIAGLEPNPELFARKLVSKDGHRCDSFTEKIIDDWLYERGIAHQRAVRYGDSKFTADFGLKPNILVEFFGLAGVQKNYDQNIKKKRALAHKFGYRLIEIYPEHVYPQNRLSDLLEGVAR